jgi:hypothetical protein
MKHLSHKASKYKLLTLKVFYRMPKDQEWSVPSNAGGGKSVMFWACISINAYGPLVEVKGKNTAAQYIEILSNYLLPKIRAAAGPVTFQQDKATIDKTPAVRALIKTTLIFDDVATSA